MNAEHPLELVHCPECGQVASIEWRRTVGGIALLIGAGTAWLISLHDFRGRRMLIWLMPLPLAIPTYLAAYVYVDLFEPLGLVHRTLTIWFLPGEAIAALPNLRSLPGAIVVIVDQQNRTMLTERGANAELDPDAVSDDLLAGAGLLIRTAS